MGVPVITLAGKTHISRVGVSILTNAGLPELIAADSQSYIEIAANLAADSSRLACLRSAMRDRLSASPLLDASRFTRNLESVYREMFRAWASTA
jgi:predicted O-linked N-acetylglucosamine transferase (SPINDLY family)